MIMGSAEVGNGSDYDATKGRIDCALETLRNQLMEMQQQDVVLLRQLMHIHSSIQTLAGCRGSSYRRSLSSNYLSASLSCGSVGIGSTEQGTSESHGELLRLQSAPLRRERSQDTDDGSEYDEEEEVVDRMTQSFSSFSTEPLELSFEMSRLHSTPDTLPPIPRSFRRKLIAPIDESPEPEPLPERPPSPKISEALDYPDSFISEIIPRENWSRASFKSKNIDFEKMSQYEPSYETMLKRSSQLWRDVQKEKEEKGTVDHKKMTTLKLFL